MLTNADIQHDAGFGFPAASGNYELEILTNGAAFPGLSVECSIPPPFPAPRPTIAIGALVHASTTLVQTCDLGSIGGFITRGRVPWSLCTTPIAVGLALQVRVTHLGAGGPLLTNSRASFHMESAAWNGCGTPGTVVWPPISNLTTVATYSGGVLFDTATLSGTFNGTPGGTITFKLYGPSDLVTPLFTDVVAVSGAGVYVSPSHAPTAGAGIYRYVATYSGDGTKAVGASTNINDPNEQATVSLAAARVPFVTLVGAS